MPDNNAHAVSQRRSRPEREEPEVDAVRTVRRTGNGI